MHALIYVQLVQVDPFCHQYPEKQSVYYKLLVHTVTFLFYKKKVDEIDWVKITQNDSITFNFGKKKERKVEKSTNKFEAGWSVV